MKRETSSYERVLYYYGNNTPMYFAFCLQVKGKIKKTELAAALHKMQQRHPLARVKVQMTEQKKQYISTTGVPPIPVKEYNQGDLKWDDLVKQELCLPFDIYNGPMIRISLIHKTMATHVVAVFHHALCDGLSGVLFLHELFTFLIHKDMPVKPYTEAPLLSKLIKKQIVDVIKQRGMPDWLKNKEHLRVELKPVKPQPYLKPNFALLYWFLNKDKTNKIILMAKKNNISVHSILGAVFLKAFAEEYGEKQGYERTLQCPVNFKPFFIEQAKQYMGLFNGLVTMKIDCTPEKSIFEIASEIYKELKEKMSNYIPLDMYYYFGEYFLEGVEDPELLYANRSGNPMDYDFSLSNLGKIQIQKDYGKYEIEEVYGPIFSAVKGERVIGINTHQNRMFFSLIYDKDCFDHETGKRIQQHALKTFNTLLGY